MLTILFALLTLSLNPSLKFAISNNEISTVKNKIADLIFGNFNAISLPGIDYEFVHLKDIKLNLQGFTGDHLDIIFVEGSSNISIVGHDVGFLIQAKAQIDAGNLSTDLNVSANKMGCIFNMTIGADNDLKPEAYISGMKLNMNPDDLQVIFSGNPASWVVTLIVTIVKTIFANEILSKLETTIPQAINLVVDNLLSKIPTQIDIGPITVYTGLTNDPFISNSYLIFPMITMIKGGNDLPFEPTIFPNTEPNSNKGVQILFNDFVYNNVIHLLCKEGALHLNFSSKLFGYNFTFECGFESCPKVAFTSTGLSTLLDGIIAFKVIGIKIDLKVKAEVSIKPQIVKQNIGLLIENIKVTNIKIMGFEALWLSNLLNPLFQNLKGILNGYLDDIEIPIPSIGGINYSDVSLDIYDGFMGLALTPTFDLMQLLLSP
jgi:hypothetical protein